jgi:VWFA-related protein
MFPILSVLLALIFGCPAWAFAQQPAPAANAAPPTAQQPSSPPSAGQNPQLVDRPRPPSTERGAITPAGHIHLDVLVSDAAGKPVTGLGPQDFKILDNGEPRRLLSFRSFDGVNVKPAPPVEVILVLDTVNLPFAQVSFVRQQITAFLQQNGGHLAQPLSIMLLTDAGLRVQPHSTVDGNALKSVVDQIKGGVHSIYGAMGSDGELQRFQLSLRQMATIAENEATRPGRKLLIWVGPGWPLLDSKNFTFSDKDQRTYFDTIVELSTKLREARMPVYSISPSNVEAAQERALLYQDFLKPVTSPRRADTGDLALQVLALQSGGRVLGPDNNLVEQINACIGEANAFYSLSFDPSHAAHANEFHTLKVEASQPGVSVRTNSAFYDQP